MNWYKICIAAGRIDFLSTLNLPQNIVDFIMSFDVSNNNIANILTNEARKNPQITLVELQNIANQSEETGKSPWEKDLTNMAKNFAASVIGYGNILDRFVRWFSLEIYKYLGLKGKIYNQEDVRRIKLFLFNREAAHPRGNEIRNMLDWYRQELPDLNSYTLDRALDASAEWHATAFKGEGEYDPKDREVVWGPFWKDAEGRDIKEWHGWTIQDVQSKNDLEAEGNKMDNCVGGYCGPVSEGISVIYSLRDPDNNPHVTIEIDETGKYIKQIYGKSNSEPKDEYKDIIRHWIASDDNSPSVSQEEVDPADFFASSNLTWTSISTVIEEWENAYKFLSQGEFDEYGLKKETDTNKIQFVAQAYENAYDMVQQMSSKGGYDGDSGLGEIIVRLAVDEEDEGIDMLLFELNKALDVDYLDVDYLDSLESDLVYPYEPDYEDDEEYEKAMEEYEKEVEYRYSGIFPFGWRKDIRKELDEQMQKRMNISLEDWIKQAEKANKM
jgi:hypothetical protein